MDKKIMLVALALTSLSFANEWNLKVESGYKGTLETVKAEKNKKSDGAEGASTQEEEQKAPYEFKPTIPLEIELGLASKDIDFNWNFKIKNEEFDGLFKTNNLDKTEVTMDADYTTPKLAGGLKLFAAGEIIAYKTGESGDIKLNFGPMYEVGNTTLKAIGEYKSNQIVNPKHAGGTLTSHTNFGKNWSEGSLSAFYDFESASKSPEEIKVYKKDGSDGQAQPLSILVPVKTALELKGGFFGENISYKPEFKLELDLNYKKATRVVDDETLFAEDIDMKPTLTIKPLVLEANYKGFNFSMEDKLTINTADKNIGLLNDTRGYSLKDSENIALKAENELETKMSYDIVAHDKLTVTPEVRHKNVLTKGNIIDEFKSDSDHRYDMVNELEGSLKLNYTPVKDLNLYVTPYVEGKWETQFSKDSITNRFTHLVPGVNLGINYSW